jgi:hypothetical protein
VEKLELMPMLTLDNTMRTTFVSSCSLYKFKSADKIIAGILHSNRQ